MRWSPSRKHARSFSMASQRRVVSLLAHVLEVLHGQEVDVQEALHAVGHARLLGAVQALALDGAGDALLPAHFGEGVGSFRG